MRRVVALAAAGTVLAGCGPDAPDVPDGFTTTEVERLQVAHPADWAVSDQEEDAPAPTAVSHEVEGAELARIDIRHEFTMASTRTHAVGVATQGRHGILPDYEHEPSDIEGTGAEEARRIDFAFTDDEGEVTGEPGPIEGVDVVLLGSDNWAHHVVVSWAEGELDPETVEAIVATVYLDE